MEVARRDTTSGATGALRDTNTTVSTSHRGMNVDADADADDDGHGNRHLRTPCIGEVVNVVEVIRYFCRECKDPALDLCAIVARKAHDELVPVRLNDRLCPESVQPPRNLADQLVARGIPVRVADPAPFVHLDKGHSSPRRSR